MTESSRPRTRSLNTTGWIRTRHAVAVIGGSTAGAEAVRVFSGSGIRVVVFEQNRRPYGKVEDGLPRWHTNLRRKEFADIDAKLDDPNVDFVPATRIGRDVTLSELLNEWGFDAVILAHGAWRDRPLPIPGIDAYLGRGLVYQNSFIYWFNHYEEAGYEGPRYHVEPGTIVVGGGLASLDVIKVVQFELTRAALAERGIEVTIDDLSRDGVPKLLERFGLHWEDLSVRSGRLFYRRRIQDMPLVEMPEGAAPEVAERIGRTREKILEKARAECLFEISPLHLPVDMIVEQDRLAGLVFEKMEIANGSLRGTGERVSMRAPLVISSIGSIPEDLGLAMVGDFYAFRDPEHGELAHHPNLYGVGNAVTGKGNLVVSRKHAGHVARHVAEQIAGIAGVVLGKPERTESEMRALDERVRAAQRRVGYDGNYRAWIDASFVRS